MIRTDRRGFALPMTILVIGFLTASLMAAFARVGSESRNIDDQRAQQLAYSFASAGIERHVAQGGSIQPADTIGGRNYTFTGGTANVRVRLLRRSVGVHDTATYMLTSTGRTTASGPGRPVATRTTSLVVYRITSTMPVLSSWTSLTGLDKNGNSGDINGADFGTCPDAIGNTVAGAAMPTGTFTGQTGAFSGSPAIDQGRTQAQLMADIGIDWHAYTDPTSVNYPRVIPTRTYCVPTSPNHVAGLGPCTSTPLPLPGAGNSYWDDYPVTVVNGDYSQDVSGTGLLIVTGNLTVGGNSKWRGIILVGGQMIDNGISDVEGAVVSGLNVLKGQPVGQSSVGNGTKFYRYNSCEIQQATAGMGRFTALRSTWGDSWWGM